jgi:hypothetical protein
MLALRHPALLSNRMKSCEFMRFGQVKRILFRAIPAVKKPVLFQRPGCQSQIIVMALVTSQTGPALNPQHHKLINKLNLDAARMN